MDYVFVVYLLAILLSNAFAQHDCEIEQGSEVNLADDSCESYWTCKDYEGKLTRCVDDMQFDYAWRECRPNREVWCQWQVQTVQKRRGLKGTPFDPTALARQVSNVRKPWLRERVNGKYRPILTYNGERPAKSYTHTHDGSTHMHLLDADGQYIDTTDHFHASRGSPSIVREKREVKEFGELKDVGLVGKSPEGMKSQEGGANKFHKKLGGGEKDFNRRSKELGMDYDVTNLKTDKESDDEGGSKAGNDGDSKNEFPETYDEKQPNAGKDEYYDYEGSDLVCNGDLGREPDLEDSNCKLFWECTKESVSYMECDDNYLYDFEKKDCVIHTQVNCKEQLDQAKQMKSRRPSVNGKKGNDMTVVHHFYHGGAKPLPGKLPDEIIKDDEDDFDPAGERTILPKKRDFTILTNADLSNYSSEDSIIKRIRGVNASKSPMYAALKSVNT